MNFKEWLDFEFGSAPIKSAGKAAIWWWVLIPGLLVMLWGYYNPKSLPSVFFMSVKRGAGAFLMESREGGQVLYKQRFNEDPQSPTPLQPGFSNKQ